MTFNEVATAMVHAEIIGTVATTRYVLSGVVVLLIVAVVLLVTRSLRKRKAQ